MNAALDQQRLALDREVIARRSAKGEFNALYPHQVGVEQVRGGNRADEACRVAAAQGQTAMGAAVNLQVGVLHQQQVVSAAAHDRIRRQAADQRVVKGGTGDRQRLALQREVIAGAGAAGDLDRLDAGQVGVEQLAG